MDNAYLGIENKEVEVLIDNGGGIEGFSVDDKLVDFHNDNPDQAFILEHMAELQEEAAHKIREWEHRHPMNRAYWEEG